MSALVEELRSLVDERRSLAAQAYVSVNGRVAVDWAYGVAGPGLECTPATPFNLYCGLKPLSTIALLTALEGMPLVGSLESALKDAFNVQGSALGAATMAQLLCHDVGLRSPSALELYFSSADAQLEILDPLRVAATARPGVAAYSEVSALTVLAALTERLCGEDPIELVNRELLSSGMGFVANDLSPRERATIGCYYDMRCDPPIPLLHDRLPRFTGNRSNIGIGGYASANAIGRWLDEMTVGGATRSRMADVFRECMATSRGVKADETLGRGCDFAAGMLRGLEDHGFGPGPSPQARGFLGFMGCSFGFLDPPNGIVAAVLTNGIDLEQPQHAAMRRAWLTSRIIADALKGRS